MFDYLIARFSLLICELREVNVELKKIVVNKKLLRYFPKKWEVRAMMIEDSCEFDELSLDELIQKLQGYELVQ